MKIISAAPVTIIAGSIVAVFSTSALALTPPAFTDLNGDGVISEAEVSQIIDSHRATILSEYDVDSNGKLSRLERREAKDARYGQLVLQFDANGDGELSREERKSARAARHASLEVQFDVNQDGNLSEEERAGLESVKKFRGRSGKHDTRAGGKHRGDRNPEEVTEQTTE